MKIGDLVKYLTPAGGGSWVPRTGTVLEFPTATHAKEFQKVRVLTSGKIEDWIMQFCEVINAE